MNIDVDKHNRSFLYGDGFFETIRIQNGVLPLLSFHLERARHTASYLQMRWNDTWNEDYFSGIISRENIESGIFRLTFYRSGGGTYIPDNQSAQLQWSHRPLTTSKGLFLSKPQSSHELHRALQSLTKHQVGVYSELSKSMSPISNFKTTSSIIYVMAGMFLRTTKWYDIIICNTEGRVCEGLSSNILIFSHRKWLTPALSEGPVGGTFLSFLKTFLDIEEVQMTVEELRDADQSYLINAIEGFRRVSF